MNGKSIAIVSIDAVTLCSDQELAFILTAKGVDLSRKLRWVKGLQNWLIFYED